MDAAAFLAWRAHRAQELGLEPELEDHGLSWSLYFRAPDGNPYEITGSEHAVLAPALAGS